MKIDAIIGNPPYQLTTEKTSDAPVYHHFIDLAIQLSPRATLITPARYLFNSGKTPKAWNARILSDKHFRVVWYKANSRDVFPTADIKGGIAVMYRDQEQSFAVSFAAYPELNSIAQKVSEKSPEGASVLSDIIYAQNKFDLNKLYVDYPEVREIIGSEGRERRLTTSIFTQLPALFNETPLADAYQILGLIDTERCYRWVKKRYIEEHPNLERYKVLVPKSNGTGAIGEVLSTPLIGEPLIGIPLIGVTQTFITIGAFETRVEAEACLKYVKTRFARTMLGVLKVTQDNPKDTWRLVPLQDFTSSSDIDWSQSVADIDQQLYRKYGLEPEEIAFIEEKVRAME